MMANNKLYLCSDESVTFDLNYRYKVDLPIYEVKTKKGSNLTCFTNSVSFATSIEFDHQLLTRLIGQQLSCKSSIDKDLKCAVFQGVYTTNKINGIICFIIQNYLLCRSCDKPEVIIYKKKKMLKHQCKACGEKNVVKEELECTDIYETICKTL